MIAPNRQDEFLDQGFFRTGHTVRRTRFLFVERAIFSTIWSRVALQTFSYRKSQRKLLRRCAARFRHEILPYRRTVEQDELYDRYQRAHPLEVGRTLEDVFGSMPNTHPFDTYRCLIYDGTRLVGFSCFDLGTHTLASIFAAYDPGYAGFSLGFYTMLLELRFGRDRGLEHYHPGYCVPGLAAFAYKLRLPDLEGRTFLTRWRPMAEVTAEPLPHEALLAATERLEVAAQHCGLPYERRFMPLSEILPAQGQDYGPMPLPLMLRFAGRAGSGDFFAGYDPEAGDFAIWYGYEAGDLADEPDFAGIVASVPEGSSLKFYGYRKELARATAPLRLMLALALRL